MQNLKTDNKTIYDSVIYDFNSTWESVNFEDTLVRDLPSYKKYKRNEMSPEGKIPVIDQGFEDIAGYTNDESGKYSGSLPLIIFGDHTRNIKYVDFEFAVGADGTKLLKPIKKLNEKFFYYYLKSIFIPSSGYSRHYKYLKEIKVPIPDKQIQQRIIKHLDDDLPKVQKQLKHLDKAKKLLANFRHTILSTAFTGKLTEHWREKEGVKINNVLEVIQQNINNYNQSLGKPKKYIKTDFEEYEFETNFDLPGGWVLENLGNISELVTDGEHATPQRVDDGVYLLSARNVQNGHLLLSKVDYIPESEYERIIKRCNPLEGDVLISCSGSVGRVCVVPKDVRFTLVRSVALVKMQANLFLSEYLALYLQSPLAQDQILKLQKATAQANLFIGQIKKIVVVIPSIEEQKEIVKKVRYYFGLADKVELQIEKAELSVSKLERSILLKVFNHNEQN